MLYGIKKQLRYEREEKLVHSPRTNIVTKNFTK